MGRYGRFKSKASRDRYYKYVKPKLRKPISGRIPHTRAQQRQKDKNKAERMNLDYLQSKYGF